MLFKEISLWPEVSNQPRFRIKNSPMGRFSKNSAHGQYLAPSFVIQEYQYYTMNHEWTLNVCADMPCVKTHPWLKFIIGYYWFACLWGRDIQTQMQTDKQTDTWIQWMGPNPTGWAQWKLILSFSFTRCDINYFLDICIPRNSWWVWDECIFDRREIWMGNIALCEYPLKKWNL